MTLDELKANYTVAYRIITRNREARDEDFAKRQLEPGAKMHDMDVLLEIVDDFKNELKERISREEPQQPLLLDVPQKATYS